MSIRSQYFAANQSLKPYINGYIWNEITVSEQNQTVDLFPVGHSVLSFAFDDLPLYFEGKRITSRYNITGQLTRSFKMQAKKGKYKTLMVLLKPYAAYRLFGHNQQENLNTYLSITEIDNAFGDVSQHLSQSLNIQQRIHLIEKWLSDKIEECVAPVLFEHIKQICDTMLENNGHTELHKLYAQLPFSVSTIERHFKKYIGITPKKLNRILRFNYAYTMICKGNYSTWMDIVMGHGYFDQAHFIKEFKSFYGYSPSQLHKSLFNIAGHVSTLQAEI